MTPPGFKTHRLYRGVVGFCKKIYKIILLDRSHQAKIVEIKLNNLGPTIFKIFFTVRKFLELGVVGRPRGLPLDAL